MRKSPIASALFSRTQQRLLSALLLNSREPVYSAELARRFAVRPSTLQRDLSKLSLAGIINLSRSGNRVYYQANENCPVFPELRSLVLKTCGLVDFLHDELALFAGRIIVAAVYGSVASEMETSAGDIDLLVIGTVKMMDLVPMLERATGQLRRQVNPTIFTPDEFCQKARGSHFVRSVLGKPLQFVLGSRRDLEAITGRKPHHRGTDQPD